MKKYIAPLLLLSSLAVSASDEVSVNATSYYGPITTCQYEYAGSTPMSMNNVSASHVEIQGYMIRYRHKGYIQCLGPIHINGKIYTFDTQWYSYGRL
ncbi:hypothetical protein [Pseudoalteromonas luteoviolacea]|uniref:Uncharacterized protein n=1 Tax=Pseudoalteromonas luteoviolacea H33 TaxID=1365251 RepID=A0A167FUW1_9GAMM|nr:hypothetical protein [Pseudoalteromonas luteoviolacea]KZN53015.1 hypothetical protein N476_09525 [Pseudoalteromonas luteoviolacea H33]KZN78068.1 hypothetical protein N477_10540 [Pseudoalteromonas luteoviolacea H33-S]MBQ4875697.1 hypothetical protein [Pseudoalteromonas luteoviolacea]MBQ4904732.1 hypothetical protein [Pseudoalteromonas luteoviolacea]